MEKINTDGYEKLSCGIGKYSLYRKIENGKGKWLAEDTETGEVFSITYQQALGNEPIRPTEIEKLSRFLGEKLLPKK